MSRVSAGNFAIAGNNDFHKKRVLRGGEMFNMRVVFASHRQYQLARRGNL
jgi:hypothetical protein